MRATADKLEAVEFDHFRNTAVMTHESATVSKMESVQQRLRG